MKTKIETTSAPGAIGPYSQGVMTEGLIFVSGQLPADPASGALVAGGVAEQCERSILNMQAILAEAGAGLEDVVKTTVFLKDIADFSAMNEVYARYFHGVCPARSAFQAAALPKGALVEIEAIAVRK